jgi:DNA-binding response OmpR family regulator
MRTILCVDDHHATLLSLSLILQAQGYRCITAENADEADRSFAAEHIDLVIVDYGLPDVDGATLATQLKSKRPTKVLMLSGNAELNEKPESVDMLLPKPQHPTGLIAAVSSLLQSLQNENTEAPQCTSTSQGALKEMSTAPGTGR